MPNTNFQTIHQMGQAINEVVRQATGRDTVQNIDMDHVTVAQTRYFEDATASGSMVSFTDSVGGMPLEKCVVQIEPVQDLHGYNRPWAGGAGKNLLNENDLMASAPTVTLQKTGEVFTLTATNATWASTVMPGGKWVRLRAGVTYVVSAYVTVLNYSETYPPRITIRGNNNIVLASALIPTDNTESLVYFTYTPNEDVLVYFSMLITGGTTTSASVMFRQAMIEAGSAVTDYEPYENICPITGWTGANIHVSPTTDAQDGTTYSITFPTEAGTVYGGTLKVIKGVLTVTDGYIASYNGEALPGKWISDRDVYAEGTSPTTGAEVVYELDNPITYQITPQEILTLEGQNNIWADTGDIEVTYKVLGGLY